MAGTSMVRFLYSVVPPLPFRPATRSVSSGKPACGASFISIPRSVPTSTTSLSFPRASHSRAIASAGKTCPPVPPPAINNFIAETSAKQRRSKLRHYKENKSASTRELRGLLRDIQKHSGAQQHHQQTRSAVADERQRNALRGHHSEDHGEIDERLPQNHGCDSQSEQTAKGIGRREGRANSTPAVNDKKRDDEQRTDEAEFFANHGVDEIGMSLGQVEKFLFAFHQADAGEAAGTHGDERLPQLKASALGVGGGIPKGEKARHAIRSERDKEIKSGHGCREASRDPFPRESRDEENRRRKQ